MSLREKLQVLRKVLWLPKPTSGLDELGIELGDDRPWWQKLTEPYEPPEGWDDFLGLEDGADAEGPARDAAA